jgi:hypothetical protein
MKFKNSAILFLSIFILTSCSKTSSSSSSNSQGKKVYVVGYSGAGDSAVYWKDGKQYNLAKGNAGAITTSGSDVYIYGVDSTGGLYWKNGIKVKLETTNINANTNIGLGSKPAIAVSGKDVYVVAGAVYWKNSVPYPLQINASESVATNGIAVLGNDVYVSGFVDGATDTAVYWKNGVRYKLQDNAGAVGVSIYGNDIYFGGIHHGFVDTVVYWKNGDENVISTTGDIGGIVVQGSDIYAYGISSIANQYCGMYWHNGDQQFVAPIEPSYGAFTISGMAVSGNDVCVAGYYATRDGNETSFYWKNGELTTFPNGFWAYGIAFGE